MRKSLQDALTAARSLPAEDLPELLGELEQIRCTALARLSAPTPLVYINDELVNIKEGARRLGVSTEYLYHNHGNFPIHASRGPEAAIF